MSVNTVYSVFTIFGENKIRRIARMGFEPTINCAILEQCHFSDESVSCSSVLALCTLNTPVNKSIIEWNELIIYLIFDTLIVD